MEQKTQVIGVVLSGTGTDGTEGLKAIKAEGGITFCPGYTVCPVFGYASKCHIR